MSREQKARQEVSAYLASRADDLRGLDMRGALAWPRAVGTGARIKGQPDDVRLGDVGDARLRIELTASKRDALEKLVADAAHSQPAWDACMMIMMDIADRGENVPAPLAKLGVMAMAGEVKRPSRRGQDRMKNASRDFAIAMAVYRASQCDLPAYASGNGTGVTACDIVADELKQHRIYMTPEAVKKVWNKYAHLR